MGNLTQTTMILSLILAASSLALNHQTNQSTDSLQEQQPDTSKAMDSILAAMEKQQLQNELLAQSLLSKDEASQAVISSIDRRNDAFEAHETAATRRRDVERQLQRVQSQSIKASDTIRVLQNRLHTSIESINALLHNEYSIQVQKRRMAAQFRSKGLENWVHSSLKHSSVSPFVRGAVMQGTTTVVEPMLDGLESLGTVNDKLTRQMAEKFRSHVPMVERPFYSGFVTYAVLLIPMVLVTSIMMRIKRGIAKLTLKHITILSNFYFGLLSGGCFAATLIGSVDVLITFRHHNDQLFDFIMFLHAFLYAVHIAAHVTLAAKSRERAPTAHAALTMALGMHFFIHSYRHALHNEDSHVDPSAYLIYTAVCVYIFYKQIALFARGANGVARSKSMTLNNASITTTGPPSVDVVVTIASRATSPCPPDLAPCRVVPEPPCVDASGETGSFLQRNDALAARQL